MVIEYNRIARGTETEKKKEREEVMLRGKLCTCNGTECFRTRADNLHIMKDEESTRHKLCKIG